MGKIVNQGELSEIMGVSDVSLWEWQKEGLPILRRGSRGEANEYDTAEVMVWWLEREMRRARIRSPRDVGIELDNRMKEIALAEKERQLVPVDQIEPVWRGRVLSAAAFLAGQHSRLAGILEATPGVEAKRQVLRETFAAFLTRMGVDGERMEEELDKLLAQLPVDTVEAFMRRIAGDAEVING